MILLDILTARAAFALADSECADWLMRPMPSDRPACAACGKPVCGHSDPEYQGVVAPSRPR